MHFDLGYPFVPALNCGALHARAPYSNPGGGGQRNRGAGTFPPHPTKQKSKFQANNPPFATLNKVPGAPGSWSDTPNEV